MGYNEEDYLMISGIQHFVFCRRQWGLIHIEGHWTENVLTAEGKLLHDRVHDAEIRDKRGGILTVRGLQVRNSTLGITGTCDAVEFVPDKDGTVLFGREGYWMPRPVEYKHGEPKVSDCDRLQAAAQAICLEEMFCCDVPEAFLYYHGTRHREAITITDELKCRLSGIIEEMHQLYSSGHTPVVKPSTSCKSCSLKDICLPKMLKKHQKQTVSEYITSHIKDSGE